MYARGSYSRGAWHGRSSGSYGRSGVRGPGGYATRTRAHGAHYSDLRLKTDVALVGRLDSGIGLYRFRFLGESTIHVGVIAQDVQARRPQAVVRGNDGYLRVYYQRIGTRMWTWDEWTASDGTAFRQPIKPMTMVGCRGNATARQQPDMVGQRTRSMGCFISPAQGEDP